MLVRAETQITQNWECHDSPIVSIVCVTYNHEPYIKDAIDSFLMQETNFPFEIIIQDDASTDKTTEIVRQYTEKYPRIIKSIYNKENQFSRNGKNVLLTTIPYLNGRYIAICDGDDFWIDSHKLQIQIDEMEKHPNCNISFHPGIYRRVDSKVRDTIFSNHSQYNKIFTPKEIIMGGGGFCLTPSLVIKRKIFTSLPEWFYDVKSGDYFLQMLSSLEGGALYINRVMTVYRANTPGSWSINIAKDGNYFYYFYTALLKSLDDMNSYTKYTYTNELHYVKRNIAFYMCRGLALSSNDRKLAFKNYNHLFTCKQKLIWYFLCRNKRIFKLIYAIKKKIFD